MASISAHTRHTRPYTPTPQDDIQYIPTMDAYVLPGRLFPITVKLKQNLCSQCGSRRPKSWCSHLKNAALKAGMKIADSPVYLKNLSQLRKNQRADKSKSGRKQPRKFDLVPIKELYTLEETESIQLDLDSSYERLPRSSVDDVIESVVAEVANQVPVAENDEGRADKKLWCLCQMESSGDMIACDNLKCDVEWFHFTCMDITAAPDGEWFCPKCQGNQATKRKLQFEDEPTQAKKQKTSKQKTKCTNCGKSYAHTYIKTHVKKFCQGIN